MKLQAELSNTDTDGTTTLWLLATEGIDGDGGVGLVYTLMKEFKDWKIHLGVFPQDYDAQSSIDTILGYNGLLDLETVVHFTPEGIPMIPKIVPRPPPVVASSFDPSAPWVSGKNTIKWSGRVGTASFGQSG